MEDYIFAYLEHNGSKSFKEAPFNLYDAFIFSLLSYIPYEPKNSKDEFSSSEYLELINDLDETEFAKRRKLEVELGRRVFASLRYKDTLIVHPYEDYDVQQQKRFFAISYIINNEILFVSYRGTDSTTLGWKEDLNMSFEVPIPSQITAANYLNKLMDIYPSYKVVTGGHSKGGSLAVYAITQNNCDRILNAYNFDGPGFLKSFYETTEYQAIDSKVIKIIPESSIIGLLLSSSRYEVIKSTSKGIMQHDPFNWIIEDDEFVFVEDIDENYKTLSISINTWVSEQPIENRKLFCDSIYSVFQGLKIEEFKNTKENKEMVMQSLKYVVPFLKTYNKETVKMVLAIFNAFIKIYASNRLRKKEKDKKEIR